MMGRLSGLPDADQYGPTAELTIFRMYPGPLPAWLIAVASTIVCKVGLVSFAKSCWNFGGTSTTNVYFAVSMAWLMLSNAISLAGRNKGGNMSSPILRAI